MGFHWWPWGSPAGTVYTSTAGHCGPVGTSYYAGSAGVKIGETTRGVLGNYYNSHGTTVNTDASLISNSVASRMSKGTVWHGSNPSTTVQYPVVGWIDDKVNGVVGKQVNCGGANSGNHLGSIVLSSGGVPGIDGTRVLSFNGIPVTITGLTTIYGTGNTFGDSGAPCVSSKAGAPGQFYARGQVVGGTSVVTYYAPMNDISAALRASIVLAP